MPAILVRSGNPCQRRGRSDPRPGRPPWSAAWPGSGLRPCEPDWASRSGCSCAKTALSPPQRKVGTSKWNQHGTRL